MISLKTEHTEVTSIQSDALVMFIPSDEKNHKSVKSKLGALLGKSITPVALDDVTGKLSEATVLYTPDIFSAKRIIICGIGESKNISIEYLRRAGSAAAKTAERLKLSSVTYLLDIFENNDVQLTASLDDITCALAEGAMLGTYKFSDYISDEGQQTKTLKSVSFNASRKHTFHEIKKSVLRASSICKGVYLARDLGNTPGIDLYPETLANIARDECRKAGCKVTIFDEKRIQSLKMGGIVSVSRGSERPPRFIIIEWNGGKRSDQPYVLIGKGITFDTGGISIKPSAGMGEMKMDMSGAAAVIGTMQVAATLKLPVNVVGIIPACENMPSGKALRPGDVIRIMNGKTVEVDNTDAEGRLILADALVFAKKYKPKTVVDLATLTGACVVALGHYATGMMGNDNILIESLKAAGERAYERVWELPLYDEYEKLIKSDIADVKNLGGRWAGAITAGWFLKKFVDDYPWVHLDIAGTAILEENADYTQKGASGVGVRLLIEWLRMIPQ
jgi:leucyl aminopeptidase